LLPNPTPPSSSPLNQAKRRQASKQVSEQQQDDKGGLGVAAKNHVKKAVVGADAGKNQPYQLHQIIIRKM
jgi:hypothetical protein